MEHHKSLAAINCILAIVIVLAFTITDRLWFINNCKLYNLWIIRIFFFKMVCIETMFGIPWNFFFLKKICSTKQNKTKLKLKMSKAKPNLLFFYQFYTRFCLNFTSLLFTLHIFVYKLLSNWKSSLCSHTHLVLSANK